MLIRQLPLNLNINGYKIPLNLHKYHEEQFKSLCLSYSLKPPVIWQSKLLLIAIIVEY